MIVSFNDFQRLDLRIGKIIQVDPLPQADKLYVMKIDIGGETKQSVAGLKTYFTPERLLNKSVAVITNLQPARLRGVESQVMLLAATAKDKVVLLIPEEEIPAGSKIS